MGFTNVHLSIPRAALADLFHRHTAPSRWLSATFAILTGTLAVIVVCVALSRLNHGNNHHLFGEKRLGTYASVFLLAAGGVTCFLIHRRTRGGRIASFWLAFGILMCITAVDDLVRLHERIDQGLHALLGWDPDHPVTDHIDDLLMLVYLVPAGWLTWRNRGRLFEARLMVQVLALATVLFVVHVAYDYFSLSIWVEESLKLVAGALIWSAFLSVHLAPALPASWGSPDTGRV